MPDQPSSADDISALYHERRKTRDAEIAVMNEVEAAIFGHLPVDYQRLFTDKDVKIQLRTLRAADDGLTKFLSEIPVLPHVDSLGKRDSQTKKDDAERVEKVAYTWLNGSATRGGTDFEGIKLQLARHQVRFADGCVVVYPDYQRKIVYLEVKDPRCHYPPVGWTPWSPTPLDGTLLVYEMTLGEVKRRFGYNADKSERTDILMKLNNAYKFQSGYSGDFAVDDAQIVKVGSYRSRDAWFVCALSDTDIVLVESETGDSNHPGVTGVMSFKQFASEPLLIGQIGIEAALQKVSNQQIQNTERINNAPYTGPPLLNDELRWGEYNVIDLGSLQNRSVPVQRHAPDSPGNLTQVMAQFLQLAQTFNYNPESNMGAGPANSGKAIQQLQAGPRSLVTNILFSPYKPAFPRIFDDCLEMELNLWPNERKSAVGYADRERLEVEYTPSVALQGYKGQIKIEEPRMGGYNAFIEEVQKRDAGLTDTLSVLEKDPDVRDAHEAMKRIEAEEASKFLKAAFEAAAAADPFSGMKLSAELLRRLGTGKTRNEAILEMLNEGLLEPPAPPDAMAGGTPPIPPELMGAIPELAGPPASLTAARGF